MKKCRRITARGFVSRRRPHEKTQRKLMKPKRLEKIDSDALNVRLTNSVIRELRDLETKERNFIMCNIPKSLAEEAAERKKEDKKSL